MILVDSSVWIDYINKQVTQQTHILDGLLGSEEIIIGDLILTEVLQGIKEDASVARIKKLFSYIECKQLGGYEIALQSANNYRKLRKKGVTVRKTIDCIIATFCIENKITLLHNDRDFNAFSDYLSLKVLT